jgi:hypothetical protein
MRNSRPTEALQEQRKLSQAINVITHNGMCLRDRLLALCKVRGIRLQGSTLVLFHLLGCWPGASFRGNGVRAHPLKYMLRSTFLGKLMSIL